MIKELSYKLGILVAQLDELYTYMYATQRYEVIANKILEAINSVDFNIINKVTAMQTADVDEFTEIMCISFYKDTLLNMKEELENILYGAVS